MKKKLSVIFALILCLTSIVFTGCSKKVEPTDSSKVESRINEYKDVDFLISADELNGILGDKMYYYLTAISQKYMKKVIYQEL